MRGQWVSQTRRLNRHYQSSGKIKYRYGVYEGEWAINNYNHFGEISAGTNIYISQTPMVLPYTVPQNTSISRQLYNNWDYRIIGDFGYDDEPYQSIDTFYYGGNISKHSKNRVSKNAHYLLSLKAKDITYDYEYQGYYHRDCHDYYFNTTCSIDIYVNNSLVAIIYANGYSQGYGSDIYADYTMQQLLNMPILSEQGTRIRGVQNGQNVTDGYGIRLDKGTVFNSYSDLETYLLNSNLFVYYECVGAFYLGIGTQVPSISDVLSASGKLELKIGAY